MINILITGASSDIGFAIADVLSYQPYTKGIGLHYCNNKRVLLNVSKKIEYFKSDFDSISSFDLIERFLKVFGSIDVLINCAGIISDVSFDKLFVAELNKVINVNFKIPYLITKDAFNAMKEKGGKIINISSNVTTFGMGRNNSIHYAASKATLDILTVGLARMGAEYNILVNSVSPGVISTKIQNNRSDLEKRKSLIPLKRLGTVEDISDMVEYLVSDKGNFITGQIIGVTGGE